MPLQLQEAITTRELITYMAVTKLWLDKVLPVFDLAPTISREMSYAIHILDSDTIEICFPRSRGRSVVGRGIQCCFSCFVPISVWA
jgi:hypothetical protein